MGKTEGDHIMRVGAQDRLPAREGTIKLAFGARVQGSDVAALARRGAGGERLSCARLLRGNRDGGLLECEHREMAPHWIGKRERRIGLQHEVWAEQSDW